MAEMKVEGRVPVAVPPHLDGLVAIGDVSRLRGRGIDLLIVLCALAPALVVLFARVRHVHVPISPVALLSGSGIALAILLIITLILLISSGQTVGMRLVGTQWVDVETGRPDAKRSIAKFLLEVLAAVPTACVLPLVILLLSQGELNRTWFDRVCGTLSVRTTHARKHQSRDALIEDGIPAPAYTLNPPEEKPKRYELEPERVPKRYEVAPPEPTPKRYELEPEVGPPPEKAARLPEALPPDPNTEEYEWMPGSGGTALDLTRPATEGAVISAHVLSDSQPRSELERSLGVRPAGAVRLVMDDGTKYDLVGSLLIGRSPVAQGDWEKAATLEMNDTGATVSKTHLALTVIEGALFVTDLGSTNGTSVSSAGGAIRPIPSGELSEVPAGSLILFGTRMILVSG